MKPLRIILVMLEPPLPFGNAAARWYYVLLKGLVERGHRVTAFAACSKESEIAKARELFPSPQYDLRLYLFPARRGLWAKLETLRRPYSYMFSEQLKADLHSERQKGFDVLHLEQLWCAWLLEGDTDRTLLNVHFLASIDLADTRGNLRWHLLRWMSNRAERHLLRSLSHISALSDRLLKAIQQINPSASLYPSRLGIDLSQYQMRSTDPGSPPTIGLIGSMGWHPSRSAAERLLKDILPRVKLQLPSVQVLIVGWNARTALANFVNLPEVQILENVPDAKPYFEKLNVLVYAPRGGSGVKVKVQEAFALGVPVVTTGEGVEGLPAEDGVHAGICEDDDGLAKRVLDRLRQPEFAYEQSVAARQMLEHHCGPEASLDAIERNYSKVLNLPVEVLA